MAKKLGGDPIEYAKILGRMKTLKMEWSPCTDWKTHYACQEARYWLAKHKEEK